MILCPSCGHENVDGTQFCEMCGEELPDSASAAPQDSLDLVKCPNCGFLNPADNVACEACGTMLGTASASTPAQSPATVPSAAIAPPPVAPSTPDPLFSLQGDAAEPATVGQVASTSMTAPDVAPVDTGAAALPAGNLAPGTLKLVVEQGQSVGAQFVLGDAEMLVGREDEDEEIYPDIDLSDQDAGYVHRRHAMIHFTNGNLTVTHLGGSNKTRVNNKPLPDDVPTQVKPGDKIGFGKVVVRVLPL